MPKSINLVEPKIIFCNEETAKSIQANDRITNKHIKIVVFENTSQFTTFDDVLREAAVEDIENFECTSISSSENLAAIVFTSGTTDYPKALAISYKRLGHSVVSWVPQELVENTRGTWWDKTCWFTSIKTALSTIINRATFVIHDDLEVSKLGSFIEKYKVIPSTTNQ